MKVAAILVMVWMGIFGAFISQLADAFGPAPLSITPHWLTYLPTLSIVTGVAGLVLYKVLSTAETRRRVKVPAAAATQPQLTEA